VGTARASEDGLHVNQVANFTTLQRKLKCGELTDKQAVVSVLKIYFYTCTE